MNKFSGVDLLRELCLAFGPSGCEGQVARLILEQIAGTYDDCRTDRMGNIIAQVRGGGEGYNPESPRKIMISAHMDEVGFMINDITEEGCLKFVCVGGIDPRVLPGRGVVLGNEDKQIKGVIASKAIHLQNPEERKKVIKADKLYIDIGAGGKEEAQKQVSLGDFAVFDSDFVVFGSGDKFVKCKAIDDRLGCAVLIEVMRRLKDSGEMPYDIYFCFTVREETGYSGAGTVANALGPDFSIVVEATAVPTSPGCPRPRGWQSSGRAARCRMPTREQSTTANYQTLPSHSQKKTTSKPRLNGMCRAATTLSISSARGAGCAHWRSRLRQGIFTARRPWRRSRTNAMEDLILAML